MTIKEIENFYYQDEMKYDLSAKEFLAFYMKLISSGYKPFMNVPELQELIDKLVSWYEIKYPERELEYYEGIVNSDFHNIKHLSKYMTFDELLYRLNDKENSFLKCYYRSCCGGSHYNEELEEEVPILLLEFVPPKL